MRTIILTYFIAMSSTFAMAGNQSAQANTNVNKLLTQFTKSLNSGAFNDAWSSGGSKAFSKEMKSATTAGAVGSALSGLVQNYMVDSAFKTGWSTVKDKWIKDTKTASTISTVAGSLLTLESYIDPSMFTKKWPMVQPYWRSALQTLAS